MLEVLMPKGITHVLATCALHVVTQAEQKCWRSKHLLYLPTSAIYTLHYIHPMLCCNLMMCCLPFPVCCCPTDQLGMLCCNLMMCCLPFPFGCCPTEQLGRVASSTFFSVCKHGGPQHGKAEHMCVHVADLFCNSPHEALQSLPSNVIYGLQTIFKLALGVAQQIFCCSLYLQIGVVTQNMWQLLCSCSRQTLMTIWQNTKLQLS